MLNKITAKWRIAGFSKEILKFSLGFGFTTNLGFNLNTGDIGINYNLFNGEINTSLGNLNISSPFMNEDKDE